MRFPWKTLQEEQWEADTYNSRNSIAGCLLAAKEYLDDESKWLNTSTSNAEVTTGRANYSKNKTVKHIIVYMTGLSRFHEPAIKFVEAYCHNHYDCSIDEYNNDKDTKYQDVINLLDKCIELAKSKY